MLTQLRTRSTANCVCFIAPFLLLGAVQATQAQALPVVPAAGVAAPVAPPAAQNPAAVKPAADANEPPNVKPPAVTNSPYRIMLGANLDMSSGVKVNGFFSKVDLFLADQESRKTTEKYLINQRTGFIGSIYTNRFLSADSTKRRLINRTLVRSKSRDTLAVIAQAAVLSKAVTSVSSIGFSIHPTYRIASSDNSPRTATTGKKAYKTKLNNLRKGGSERGTTQDSVNAGIAPLVDIPHSNLYIGIHLEFVRRTYTTNFSYESPAPLDTFSIAKTATQPFPFQTLPVRPTETTSILYERYIGLSLPYRFLTTDVDIRFIPSGGRVNRGIGWQWYYAATLDITERTSGITFGAEIRDYEKIESPLIGLYISKSFLLTRLGDLLTSRN